jgi:PAS domain S-box-containing protein
LISRDGTERPIDDSAAPIRGEDGFIDGAVLVFRDITERKQAEASLRARQARYQVLVTATSDVVYLMSADWSEMQPLNGRDLVPSTTEPIHDWMQKNIPESEHGLVRDAISQAMLNQQTFELEHQVLRPDGSLGWTFSRAVPILDASGQVIEWFGTARDITTQRQAKEQIIQLTVESERRRRLYEAILSCTPDFVYVFSLDHRVLYANEALITMWGHSPEDTIGKTFLEIGYEPWHAEMHGREIDQVRETRKPIRGEVPFDGTNGRRTYDYIFVPVLGPDGEVEVVAGTTRDITERKSMENELRELAANLSEADHKKNEFIALLAHELRNPLAPIRNGLQVLRLANSNEMRAGAQEMMDRQLTHMVRLIDDLLDVSRLSRNKMQLRRARVSLAEVVSSAVETVRPLIDEAGHELTVSVPEHPIQLIADPTRLSQVFSNLLNNSARYTESGGRIWVTAERRNGDVVVSVRDTGNGIPAESLGDIFDMFSQVDRSLERSKGGLGIGLALVKGLVEMHGGWVKAESEGEGKGSVFTVTLPVVTSEPEAVKVVPKAEITSPPKRRILVVDDNRDSALSMATMLKLLGHEVQTAHDGVDAVEAAEVFRPDVILMDVGMPKLNGYEATKRIRKQPRGREITIIALTGWGQEDDRAQSKLAGCDSHLVKPVNFLDLQKRLSQEQES